MPPRADALVDAPWLAAHIDDANLRVLYCGSDDASRAAYEREHVRGAIYTDGYADFCEDRPQPDRPDEVVRALVPLRATMERILERLGVTPDDNIVCYAPARSMWPGRAYWVLRYFRFPRVHILDGGNDDLRAAGVPLTAEVVQPLPPGTV